VKVSGTHLLTFGWALLREKYKEAFYLNSGSEEINLRMIFYDEHVSPLRLWVKREEGRIKKMN